MANPMARVVITFFTLLACNFLQFTVSAVPAVVKKDQILCTMCDSCDNPCPLPSSPPPPAKDCPPPPPPPAQDCPPPPLPPSPPPPPPYPECPPPPAPVTECNPCVKPPTIMPSPPSAPMITPFPPYPPRPPRNEAPGKGSFYAPPLYGSNPTSYLPYSNNNPSPTSSSSKLHTIVFSALSILLLTAP